MASQSKKMYINDLGIINALGSGKQSVLSNLLDNKSSGMKDFYSPIQNKRFFVGEVDAELPVIPEQFAAFDCRNNQLALAVVLQLEQQIEHLKQKYPVDRIGIVMGTSTSGIAEAELALKYVHENTKLPENYHYKQQEIGAVAEFLAEYLNIKGPAYSVSTACSSSGKVFASARGLIELDICDVVITGGADSLCELTLSGFQSLEAISDQCCNPFSVNRKGINIGEGAAVFILSKEPSNIALLGVGESSDAHHMSAPEPSGDGALRSMQSALVDAQLDKTEIDYINLHGTGTLLNDSMESHAVFDLFGDDTYASSTKPLTGHTLGAAGATEIGLCWLLLTQTEKNRVPTQKFDGQLDPNLRKIKLCEPAATAKKLNTVMSNSFAFGGNNVSVIIGRA